MWHNFAGEVTSVVSLFMEAKYQPLADVIDSVEIKVPATQPKTVSEHLLAAFEAVEAAGHKTNKAQHYEIAFLELTLANQLVALFIQRRLIFLQDVVTADNKTALLLFASQRQVRRARPP